jgi:hypothetical protein
MADGLEKSDVNDIIRRLDEWSGDAYRVILDSIKTASGIANPGVWDIEHALYSAEKAAAGYVPADGQMALAEATIAGLGIKLGAMPIFFADQSTSVASPIDHVLPVHVPDDIRVPVYRTDGLASMDRVFHQIGAALYWAHIEQTDALLARPAAPCLQYAMAHLIADFVSLEEWIRKYTALPEPVVMKVESSRDARRLFHLRLLLVRIMFEKQLYANPSGDPGETYRALLERYMMVSAGGGSVPIELIMSYITDPVRYQNELVGRCICAQVCRYLRDRYGSVLDNERTREFLVHTFFRFGALDDWEALLQRGTGEPLDVSYLLIDSDN